MKNIFAAVKSKAQKHIDEIDYQLIPASLIFIFGYLGFYFIWIDSASNVAYESLVLRLIAAGLVLPILSKKYWPRKYYYLLAVYWDLVLLYLIPFFFTFMLLKNNASSTSQLNAMVGVTVLAILTNWLEAVILMVVGVSIAIIAYIFVSVPQPIWPSNLTAILLNEICIIIFIAFFTSKKNKLVESKYQLDKIKLISASMAHELRTPLRIISSNVEGLKNHLPALFNNHKNFIAQNNYLEVAPIDYDSLQFALDNIDNETQNAFTIINMLMVSSGMASTLLEHEQEKKCSIIDCVDYALNHYHFDLFERELVHWSKNENLHLDFSFICKELLIVHVFFNLLKNALYHIKEAGKGEVFIWLSENKKKHFLHFKDTGSGISSKILRHIFKQFYSNDLHGTGIGLTFCKMVMQSLHGDVHCFSRENEFTEFVLVFPKQ